MIFFLFQIQVLFLDMLLLLRKQRNSAKSVCVPQLHIFSIWGKKDFPQPPFNIWSLSHQSLVENMQWHPCHMGDRAVLHSIGILDSCLPMLRSTDILLSNSIVLPKKRCLLSSIFIREDVKALQTIQSNNLGTCTCSLSLACIINLSWALNTYGDHHQRNHSLDTYTHVETLSCFCVCLSETKLQRRSTKFLTKSCPIYLSFNFKNK